MSDAPHWLVDDGKFGVGTIMKNAAWTYKKQSGSSGEAITEAKRVELEAKIEAAKKSGEYTDAGVKKGGRRTRRRHRRRRHTRRH